MLLPMTANLHWNKRGGTFDIISISAPHVDTFEPWDSNPDVFDLRTFHFVTP